jgi:4-amino-4-deoxy-L-arabinose transferase-like glycosyltransferase
MSLQLEAAQGASKTRDARAVVDLLLILLAGLFIYGWKLGVAPLAGTEPLRALVAHQMVQGGDWMIPRIYGELYLRKPPLQYWIDAGFEKLFGVGNEFVWRLPSALGSALLAVFLAWWAARWFGPRARLVAGFGCLGILALWAQDRGGDIDALNTATSVVAACCILELGFGTTQRPWAWSIALALAVGATLLLKGPAGMPTLLGALVGPIVIRRGRTALTKPFTWLGVLIGIGIFAIWLTAVFHIARAQHLPIDSSGAQEAEERMLLRNPAALMQAIAVPFLVVLYALPIWVGLPVAFVVARRLPRDDSDRDRLLAITATFIASLLIGVIAGITNPRYSYVPMPLLAVLLTGSVAIAWDDERHSQLIGLRQFLSGGLAFCCALWFLAHGALTIGAFRLIARVDPREHASVSPSVLIPAVAVSLVLATIGLFVVKTDARRAAIAAILIVLCGIPFAEMKNAERTRYSGRVIGAELRAVVGDEPRVSTAMVNRDLPQVFYYAGVSVEAFGEMRIDRLAAAPGERWVVLAEPEYLKLSKEKPGRLQRVTPLHLPSDTLYVARYFGPDLPIPTTTTSAPGDQIP